MRTTLVGLALLIVAPSLDAVPAPDPARLPKQRLEALKKKLPDVVGEWLKKEHSGFRPDQVLPHKPKVRVLHLVAAERARAVILFEAYDAKGNPHRELDALLTVFLTYYDGIWTTDKFEVVVRNGNDAGTLRTGFPFLMVDIDEAAEKP
jgi:hypothetical protein